MEKLKKKKYSIVIVYDGNSPKEAAYSLCKYILDEAKTRSQCCEVKVISSSDYTDDLLKNNYVIIIGHHRFALKHFNSLDLEYDYYGMKYACNYKGNLAVLYASRSELGTDGTGKRAFAGYYNRNMPIYSDIANTYYVPLRFGQRSSTRQSQYDLLWMEFAENCCMTSFLDMSYAEVENLSEDELLEALIKDLEDKDEINSDREIQIFQCREDDNDINNDDENVEKIYLQPDIITDLQNNTTMDFLRSHLHYNLFMTDMWQRNKPIQEVPDNELFEGEIDAVLVPMGCYLVRYSTRVYVDDYTYEEKIKKGFSYYDRHPVDQEKLLKVKEYLTENGRYRMPYLLDQSALDKCEIVKEVSVKHITELGKANTEFHFICMAIENLKGYSIHSIGIIASIKEKVSDDNALAKLYVQHNYIGDSFSNETWYIYSPDGNVKSYRISGYDPDTWSKKWIDVESTDNQT